MKMSTRKHKPVFDPITVNLVIESEQELIEIYKRLDVGPETLDDSYNETRVHSEFPINKRVKKHISGIDFEEVLTPLKARINGV